MIFLNKDWEKMSLNEEILHFGYYHRYWNKDGTVNKDFYSDAISGLVLDLKEKKENALNFFYSVINPVIKDFCGDAYNTTGLARCCIPVFCS